LENKEKAAREARSKADAIDAAVFDLKAVNPNAVVKIDTRTSEEVIESIDTRTVGPSNDMHLGCIQLTF
jgi:type I restriction enzyme M protein